MRISTFATAILLAGSAVSFSAPAALAQVAPVAVSAEQAPLPSGTFVRKSKKLKGAWSVIERDGNTYIQFADDFRAAGGPDLKVFLSPTSIETVDGDTAVNGAINLGELQKTRGAQEYLVPEGVNLADFSSVLVHCEQYAVLWGGGAL